MFVLLLNASNEIQDVKDLSWIKSKTQLEHWVKIDSNVVLIYIVESRYERDATLECVKLWEIMIVNKKKIYDTTLKIQNRHNKSKQKLTNIKEQMISLQGLANNSKKNYAFVTRRSIDCKTR